MKHLSELLTGPQQYNSAAAGRYEAACMGCGTTAMLTQLHWLGLHRPSNWTHRSLALLALTCRSKSGWPVTKLMLRTSPAGVALAIDSSGSSNLWQHSRSRMLLARYCCCICHEHLNCLHAHATVMQETRHVPSYFTPHLLPLQPACARGCCVCVCHVWRCTRIHSSNPS